MGKISITIKEKSMSRKKGKTYSSEQKAKIILELLKEEQTIGELSTKYGVTSKISNTMDSILACYVLKDALEKYPKPKIFNSFCLDFSVHYSVRLKPNLPKISRRFTL